MGLDSQLYWFKSHKKLRTFIGDLDKVETKKFLYYQQVHVGKTYWMLK